MSMSTSLVENNDRVDKDVFYFWIGNRRGLPTMRPAEYKKVLAVLVWVGDLVQCTCKV